MLFFIYNILKKNADFNLSILKKTRTLWHMPRVERF